LSWFRLVREQGAPRRESEALLNPQMANRRVQDLGIFPGDRKSPIRLKIRPIR